VIRNSPYRILYATLAVAVACGPKPEASEIEGSPAPGTSDTSSSPVVARWKGGTLTAAEVREQMGTLSPTGQAALTDLGRRRALVNRVVTNRLLVEEGRRRGYASDPDIVRQLDELRDRLVIEKLMREIRKPPPVPEAEARAYYEENRLLYSTTQVRASHILLPDESTAIEVATEARRAPERFAELARARSSDELSAKRGGDLGLFGPGRMPTDFEQVAFSLAVGEIGGPVQTRYGWHVVLITERKEGETRSFDSVKPQIVSLLANRKLQEKVDATVERLRDAAAIEVDDAELAAVEPPPSAAASPHAGMAGH